MSTPDGPQFKLYSRQGPLLGYDDDEAQGEVSKYVLAKPGYEDPWDPKKDLHEIHGRVEVNHYTTAPVGIHHYNQTKYGQELRQPPARGIEWSPSMGEWGPSDGQQFLFQEGYASNHPGKSVVEGMYMTKESRAMALPMLAVAARDAAVRHGHQLIASTDRSRHSERLVERLSGMGVPGATERKFENSIDFTPPWMSEQRHIGEERPAEDMAQGKRDARAILRQARPRKDRSVQQELPF